MKKPEEIKKGLECCFKGDQCKGHCPYDEPGHGIFQCTSALAKDTFDYIQQLEDQVPRWIPVEERLPEDGVVVIVHSDRFGRSTHCAYYRHGRKEWFEGNGVRLISNVWHWMPLPEAPKEETK